MFQTGGRPPLSSLHWPALPSPQLRLVLAIKLLTTTLLSPLPSNVNNCPHSSSQVSLQAQTSGLSAGVGGGGRVRRLSVDTDCLSGIQLTTINRQYSYNASQISSLHQHILFTPIEIFSTFLVICTVLHTHKMLCTVLTL